MSWVVYILKCVDDSLYTGITNDLDKRITAHENGTGAKYTKGRAPFQLMYREKCDTRSTASKREIEIKRLNKKSKLKLCNV